MRTFFKLSVLLLILAWFSLAHPQWSTDPSENTRVTSGGLLPHMITDGSGGAYIVYQDSPALQRQLWAQWLDRFGYVRFPDNGVRLSNADRYQTPYYYLVSDSSGGVIVLFEELHGDENSVQNYNAVYAQRVDSSGAKLWGDAGVELAAFVEGKRKGAVSACNDGESGAFVFWGEDADSNGAYELRAQRITSAGRFAWPDSGIVVTNKFVFDNLSWPNPAVSDGAGNAIILYSENSWENSKLQKINRKGEFLWDEGVNIYPLGRQMISDNTGGAIIAGVRREFDGVSVKYIMRAQRVDCDGQVLWGEEGVTVDSLEERTNLGITLNENSEIAFVWQQSANDTLDVFLNKSNGSGNLIFQEKIVVSRIKSKKVAPKVISSTNNSNIVIWYDYRYGDSGLFSPDALFVQRIDENGDRLWSEADIEVSNSKLQHRTLQVVSDMSGGAIICWYEIGTGSGWGIFAQQVSRNGNLGEVLVTSVSQPDKSSVPTQYALHQSYPNPFNSEMLIPYEIANNNHVRLTIYEITGKEVISLINKNQAPGVYQVKWNGKNSKGDEMASGIYIYQLCTGSFVESKKAIFIK